MELVGRLCVAKHVNGMNICIIIFAALAGILLFASPAAAEVCSDGTTYCCNSCHIDKTCAHAACDSCHGDPPIVNQSGPTVTGGLVWNPSPTGAMAAGAHKIHANLGTGCDPCHFGGMQNLPPVLNNTMEIGIPNQGMTGARYDGHVLNSPYVYLGTKGTIITTNGTNVCNNLYCHSDGTAMSTGIPSVTNVTPSWNSATGQPLPCNTCHGNTTYTDWRMAFPLYTSGQPKANSHVTHQVYTCNYCHYSTTNDGTTIREHSRHANGDYGVAPDTTKTVTFSGVTATVNFNYTFDAGGGQCTNITCHNARGRNPNLRWGEDVSQFSVSMLCNRGATCYEGICSAQVIGGTNPPYTYSWNFGDGKNASSGAVNSISHIFPSSTQLYNVQVSVRDASNALGTASYPFQPGTASNQLPIAANTWTKNGYTVTITDLSYDRDYNTCGNSGPGMVTIWWTTNWITAQTYQLNLTDQPSYQTFTHTYTSPGSYRIFYDVYDNKYNNGTGPRRVDFYVTVP